MVERRLEIPVARGRAARVGEAVGVVDGIINLRHPLRHLGQFQREHSLALGRQAFA